MISNEKNHVFRKVGFRMGSLNDCGGGFRLIPRFASRKNIIER